MGSVRDHVKISVGEIIVQAVNLVAGLLLVVRVHLLLSGGFKYAKKSLLQQNGS